MPTLTFQVPRSDWPRLEAAAHAEGVSVRTWVQWRLKAELERLERLSKDVEEPAAA
jgi:hypothetical protein